MSNLVKSQSQSPARATERVILCADASGSMETRMTIHGGADSLTRARATSEAMRAIIDVSSPSITQYGIVAFDSQAYVVMPPTTNYLSLLSKAYVGSQGTTSMHDGIETALGLSPSRIILLSDGAPDYPNSVLAAATHAAEMGVKIDTISIGDSDEVLMQRIAEMTGGFWRMCQNPDDLVDAFCALESRARLLLEHIG